MKRTFFILFSLVLLIAACGHSDNNGDEQTTGESLNQDTIARQLEGDSTIYGLACEGSNDSIIVILTSIENDPDTIDILEARINRRVFGRPEIGDQLAIMMNTQRKSVADIVINIDRLKGEWCYQVMPRLRRRVGAATDSGQWHVFNGHILLSEARRDTLGHQQIISTDTADIVFMRRDTLQLRFSDHEQGYYRKSN